MLVPGKIMIKKGLSAVLSSCGLFSILDYYLLEDKAFILMYHRVLCEDCSRDTYIQPGMFVTCKSFERQVSFLSERYQILLLEELIEKINRNEKIGGCCAITFDDGWMDNYTNAFPVLKKYQAPATIFLATAFIGTSRLFWPEEICWHLERQSPVGQATANCSSPVLRFRREVENYPSDNRDFFLNKVIEVFKGYSPDDRNSVLEYFRGMGRFPYPLRQMLSWEEADEMSKSGLIAFGAHTAEHEILDQLPISKVKGEISRSKEDIEQKLGVSVTTFAYPNGNSNENIQEILQECKFVGAVTTRKGFLGRHTQLLEIPRIGIHEDICNTSAMFQARILLEKF